ncbi:shikimate kinase [Pacificibacter marinus]|nr:shikimate kinase [Pacificibacter marinus]
MTCFPIFIYGISDNITSLRHTNECEQEFAVRRTRKDTGENMYKGLDKTVALVGMMGAGKTAVGKAIAQILEVPFLDSDTEIERAADRTIAEIFERDGEAFFRSKETQVITRLLEDERCILSTGGGAFMSAENRETIAAQGVAVWLKADLDILWQRVRHKNTRPLLQTDNPFETLKSLAELRDPIYAMAGIVVDAEPSLSIEQMAQKVVDALVAHGGIVKDSK